MFWGVNSSITYSHMVILRSTAGIVNCGTTLITLATDAYHKYQLVVYNHVTELLTIPEDKYRTLHNLDFHIGDQTYSLTPNAQIWPHSLNTKIKRGKKGYIYLIFRDCGTHSGQEKFSDFCLGYVFSDVQGLA
ncbi:hypothetical protein BDR07DRAFT_1583220 [Suillus spraguei]|nr:hypothetical protein BDR07DRAFT_1583220 [Suillus spraguei]